MIENKAVISSHSATALGVAKPLPGGERRHAFQICTDDGSWSVTCQRKRHQPPSRVASKSAQSRKKSRRSVGELASARWCATNASKLGLSGGLALRQSGGEDFMTDGGHYIIDASFGRIPDAEALSRELNSIPGVVEHGLFINMAALAIIAGPAGARTLQANR